MHSQQNDKYTEMHGQQNDKYTEMHGQQNFKITMTRFMAFILSISTVKKNLYWILLCIRGTQQYLYLCYPARKT